MKPLLFRKHTFLFLSLFFFVATFSIWYFLALKEEEDNSDAYLTSISGKVNDELKKIGEESASIREIIENSDRPSFSKLYKPVPYSYFVFRNKGLYFWSVNTFSPQYESLKGNFKYKFINLRNGKYIVSKDIVKRRGDVFEVFFFLPLSADYSIQNNYISSGLNEDIFNGINYKISGFPSRQNKDISTPDETYLFSVELPQGHNFKNENVMLVMALVFAAALFFLVLYVLQWVIALRDKNRIDESILILFLFLAIVRAVMLIINYPFAWYEFDLFNSKFFASSSFSPSFGDVLLNSIFILIFSWHFFGNYYKTRVFRKLIKVKGKARILLSLLLVVFTYYALYLVFYVLNILYLHSRSSFDVTVSIDFDFFRLVFVLIFIITFVVYFIYSHIFFRLYLAFNSANQKNVFLLFIAGGVLYGIISFFLFEFYWLILLVNLFYFLVLYYLQLPKAIGRLRYSAYIYFLFCGLVCSVIGAYSIYYQNLQKSIFDKQHYASDLLFKNDVFGEYLLSEASSNIKKDIFIQNRIITPFSSKGIIEHKVKRYFLTNYFDKYDATVSIFDANGNIFEENADYSNYAEVVEKYKKEKFRTEYNNIYFFNDPETGSRKYVVFNEIKKDNNIIGYVVIDLKQKKVIPHSVYPELLVDTRFEKGSKDKAYSYGVFSYGEFLYSFGDYNYEKYFPAKSLKDEDIYAHGIINEGYHHFAVKGSDNKQIVVSSEKYSFKSIFSNFSFLFLILILFILLFIVIYAVYFRFRKVNTNYATKIQIYLNIAFFLPLLIVSITTLSIIGVSYRDNLNNSFIQKAEDISANISGYLNQTKVEDADKEKVENILLQISRYTESDINLYNNRGRLMFSNQPMIYEVGFLSKFVNPQAYASMSENMFNTLMVQESIGGLKYNSVYVGIRSMESGELVGILSMPFFESKNEIDRQLIDVLTTIINIFISIFILFLVLSYFASHLLTVPLQIITQKLKKTTLEKNEPIEWKSNDEIGLLVGEYNKMLIKLEESKEALTKSEKESAWREMAKQVAHEIKNPLTPMKLTIQHLQRTLEEGTDKAKELTFKALQVLLHQVNNLSEIATSFSLFAKMPIPKNQRFEISSVLAKTAELHNNNKDVLVKTSIEPGQFFVIGDEQLMSSIFTNVIINGVQSVSNERKPEIDVDLSSADSKVLIKISDNGVGIPAHIRDKVFLPNFSTKFSGSGIGLAVAKRGVEHAGGKIWFKTEEGSGTTFFIEIPLADNVF